MPIRYVLFDAVGTLIYPDPPVAEVYHEAGRRFGSPLAREEISQRFRNWFGVIFARRGDVPEQFLTSEDFERQRWRVLIEKVFDDIYSRDELFDELWSWFGRPSAWRLYDDVAGAWSELSSRGYQLGVASNFDARLHGVLAGHPPLSDCRHVFVSSEIGHAKPARAFYESVAVRLGARGEEILLVGDDVENDVLAPRQAGWQTVLLSRDQAGEGGLKSLHELPSLLP
jgi:putative hydrolase of the HAD superfamily